MTKNIIATNIKAERIRARLTQEEVARLLEIDRKTVMGYEKGNRIDALTLYKLSKLFNCKIEDFYMQR